MAEFETAAGVQDPRFLPGGELYEEGQRRRSGGARDGDPARPGTPPGGADGGGTDAFGRAAPRSGCGCRPGCGCLALLGLLAAVGAAAAVAWFGMSMQGPRVAAELRGNPVVRERLGRLESVEFDWADSLDRPGQDVFVYRARGTRGAGRLIVTERHGPGGRLEIVAGELVLPNGTRHDLFPDGGNPEGRFRAKRFPPPGRGPRGR